MGRREADVSETRMLPVGVIAMFASRDIAWGWLGALSRIKTLPGVPLAPWFDGCFVQGSR